VARLRGGPFTALPPMRAFGEEAQEATVERVGRLLAYELRALHFDWDFAPVLDVDTNPANPVIGDRAFSRDAHGVARLGVALARGLEAGGVASCGKHFPWPCPGCPTIWSGCVRWSWCPSPPMRRRASPPS
jgi:beta-N-acetylhexosaminidase